LRHRHLAGHATHLQPKIAVTVDELVAREPDLIIGSWCDENFRSEWVTGAARFRADCGRPALSPVRDQTASDFDAVLTDGLAQLQKAIARWAKRAIDL